MGTLGTSVTPRGLRVGQGRCQQWCGCAGVGGGGTLGRVPRLAVKAVLCCQPLTLPWGHGGVTEPQPGVGWQGPECSSSSSPLPTTPEPAQLSLKSTRAHSCSQRGFSTRALHREQVSSSPANSANCAHRSNELGAVLSHNPP